MFEGNPFVRQLRGKLTTMQWPVQHSFSLKAKERKTLGIAAATCLPTCKLCLDTFTVTYVYCICTVYKQWKWGMCILARVLVSTWEPYVMFTLSVFKSPLSGACCVVQALYICMHIQYIGFTHMYVPIECCWETDFCVAAVRLGSG